MSDNATQDTELCTHGDFSAAAQQLFSLIHVPGDWTYLWKAHNADPTKHGTSLWWQIGTPIPPLPAAWEDHSVYFGVHSCHTPGGPSSRAGTDGYRLSAARCLYADFDSKHFDNGLDGILAHLETLLRRRGVMYPTVTVFTGGGIHAYWVLEKTVSLRKQSNRDRLAQWQRLWVDEVVGSDPSTKDLGRVLRVPGTLNRKYDPPPRVEIIEANPYRVFRLKDFADLLRPFVELEDERERRRKQRAEEMADRAPTAWAQLLRWANQDAQKGHRHRTALRLAFRLKEADCPQYVAERMIEEFVESNIAERPTRGEADGIVRYVYG